MAVTWLAAANALDGRDGYCIVVIRYPYGIRH